MENITLSKITPKKCCKENTSIVGLHLHEVPKVVKFLGRESNGGGQGLGEEGMGSRLMHMPCQFGMMRKF